MGLLDARILIYQVNARGGKAFPLAPVVNISFISRHIHLHMAGMNEGLCG